MADLELPSIARAAERPFHQAFQKKKLPCPHSQCMNENCFYIPDGLDHHFRTIHGRPSTMRDVEEAKTLLRVKHSTETLAWIRKTFEMANDPRMSKFSVVYHDIKETVWSINAEEAAKLLDVYLYHKGSLYPYEKANQPREILVESPVVKARFNCWYFQSEENLEIVTECIFVKSIYIPETATPLQEEHIACHIQLPMYEENEDKALSVLRNIFKLDEFRPKQNEAIEAIISGKDCLILLPTGSGKTVCYAIPALLLPGVTIVITPLLSLLSDQVNKLRQKGINACFVRSSMTNEKKESVFHALSQSDVQYKLFYLTPEAVVTEWMKKQFTEMERNKVLGRFVIDEAHCVDTWGSTFRPAYEMLNSLKSFNRPVLAFTGTATPRTQEIIINKLAMTSHVVIKLPPKRSNLFFKVLPKKKNIFNIENTFIVQGLNLIPYSRRIKEQI